MCITGNPATCNNEVFNSLDDMYLNSRKGNLFVIGEERIWLFFGSMRIHWIQFVWRTQTRCRFLSLFPRVICEPKILRVRCSLVVWCGVEMRRPTLKWISVDEAKMSNYKWIFFFIIILQYFYAKLSWVHSPANELCLRTCSRCG